MTRWIHLYFSTIVMYLVWDRIGIPIWYEIKLWFIHHIPSFHQYMDLILWKQLMQIIAFFSVFFHTCILSYYCTNSRIRCLVVYLNVVLFVGPVMTKFTIALREIGTYKEVLRSQVECLISLMQDFIFGLVSFTDSSFSHCKQSFDLPLSCTRM